jgi:hypothetical protein
MCSNKSFESTFKEIKSMTIDDFVNKVNIIEKNIGNYKEDNKVVFINENYIPKTSQKDNKIPQYPHNKGIKKIDVGKFLGIQNMQGQQLMNIIYEQQNKNQNILQNNVDNDKQNEEKQKKILEEQQMKEIMEKKNQIEKLIYLMIDLQKTNFYLLY